MASPVRPLQVFEDNIEPARLMLHVYRLLDSGDTVQTHGDLVQKMRELVSAAATEHLMVVQNEIFVGLVRERARIPVSTLKSATLCHLLRQAIVVSCTALETFLLLMLRTHLPTVIRAHGRGFFPTDGQVREYFKDLTFGIEDAFRIAEEDGPLYLSGKLLGIAKQKHLADPGAVHVSCALLGIEKPWDAIAARLQRDKKELAGTLKVTVQRRNDIIHRADRSPEAPDADPVEITYVVAQQGVDTISHVCLAVNEIVEARLGGRGDA